MVIYVFIAKKSTVAVSGPDCAADESVPEDEAFVPHPDDSRKSVRNVAAMSLRVPVRSFPDRKNRLSATQIAPFSQQNPGSPQPSYGLSKTRKNDFHLLKTVKMRMKISCVIIADSGRKITYETGRFLFTNAVKPVGGATGFDEKQQDGAAALDKWLM